MVIYIYFYPLVAGLGGAVAFFVAGLSYLLTQES